MRLQLFFTIPVATISLIGLAVAPALTLPRPPSTPPARGPKIPGGTEELTLPIISPTNGATKPGETQLPTPPQTPPPHGGRKPGGTLDGRTNTCQKTDLSLTAITPQNAQGQTQLAQPVFWFYVPYGSQDVRVGEFSLTTRNGKRRLYRTWFTLPETPGFVSITPPPGTGDGLREGDYYHWFLNLYCSPNTTTKPDLRLDGWVLRMAQTEEAWYDRVNVLAIDLQKNPQDAQLQKRWRKLLDSVELKELPLGPIVGPVNLETP